MLIWLLDALPSGLGYLLLLSTSHKYRIQFWWPSPLARPTSQTFKSNFVDRCRTRNYEAEQVLAAVWQVRPYNLENRDVLTHGVLRARNTF